MLGDMFLWLVANLKQGVIYFINRHSPQTFQPGVYNGASKVFKLTRGFKMRQVILN